LVSTYNYLEREIIKFKRQNFYRTIKAVKINGSTAIVNGKEVIHFCSNDYLGLSRNKEVLKKVVKGLTQISQCSSRLIAGNDPKLIELEAH
jgi:7-keto-8-aminopelargonate synthetase-like enzyme